MCIRDSNYCGDFSTCKECKGVVCMMCLLEWETNGCEYCDHFYCGECRSVVTCETCDADICSKCKPCLFCDGCKKAQCENCWYSYDLGIKIQQCDDPWCRKTLCTQCGLKRCSLCLEYKCQKHLTACVQCDFIVCHFPCSCIECAHGVFCPKCKSYYCDRGCCDKCRFQSCDKCDEHVGCSNCLEKSVDSSHCEECGAIYCDKCKVGVCTLCEKRKCNPIQSLQSLTVAQLKDICLAKRLPYWGTKNEVIHRITLFEERSKW